MDNKDFDKLFSDQLGQEQDFGFQEGDWSDLNERMAAQQGNRRRFIFPFWLAAAGSILLGGIFYLWFANRLTNHELEELRSEIAQLQEGKSVDTVYREHIVYKKDTVYVKLNEQIPASVLNNRQPNPFVNQGFPANPINSESKGELPISNDESETIVNNTKHDFTAEKQKQTLNDVEQLNHLTTGLEYLPIYAKAHLNMPRLDIPLVLVRKKPVKKQVKVDFGGQVDLSAGGGFVAVKTLTGDALAQNVLFGDPNGYSENSKIVKRNSISAGIQGELTVNDNFRLTSGMYYEQLNLDVENYRAIDNIPNLELFSMDYNPAVVNVDDYRNAAVSQQTLNYDFGVKYVFESKNKWRPFLGTALLGQSSLKRNIEYAAEFNSVTNDDQAENLQTSTLSNSQPAFLYGVRGTIGTEYSISEHFGLQVEGNYNYAFRTFEDRHLTLFGLRAGVYFKF